MPRKILPIVLIVLILAFSTASVYFYQQNAYLRNQIALFQQIAAQPTPTPTPVSDPTADWNVYSPASKLYEIKYPEGWSTKNPPEEKTYSELNSQCFKITINESTEANTTLNDYVKLAIFSGALTDAEIAQAVSSSSYGKVFSTNTDFESIGIGSTGIPEIDNLILKKSVNVVRIKILSEECPNVPLPAEISQILSTFKFSN